MRKVSPAVLLLTLFSACDEPAPEPEPVTEESEGEGAAFDGLEGFYPEDRCIEILARTERLVIGADVSRLTEGEGRAIEELMAVGEVFERLYEDANHPDASAVRAHLAVYEPSDDHERAHLDALRDLYALFEGPMVWDLEGQRQLLGPIAPYDPRRNIHPGEADPERVRAQAAAHPEEGDLLGTRTLIRMRTAESMTADRELLDAHPYLKVLHPELEALLEGEPDPDGYYAVPYALAHAPELLEAYGHLHAASEHVRGDDADLADYLEQRARDLLTNDYEAGDAAWVSGRPVRLNALVGAYETYDDDLLGVKAGYAVSILVRSESGTNELEAAISELQRFEDALPGGPYQRVRSQIPIGIYEVHADYGQARGGNTATILPNEPHIARRYGRTILIRENILRDPTNVARGQARFRAAVVPEQADDLEASGNFDRTVWHEVGHYLGAKETEDGRDVAQALTDLQNHFEEMKADLVSLWLMPRLAELGVLTADRVRSAYAGGVLRTLRTVEPSRENPYATMNLMQNNYFLEHGLLSFDAEAGKLRIDYDRYPQVIEEMLTEVLAIQRRGDHAEAEAFVDRYAVWNEEIQGVIGRALDGAGARYTFVRYRALGHE
jgi:hypothetical protein